MATISDQALKWALAPERFERQPEALVFRGLRSLACALLLFSQLAPAEEFPSLDSEAPPRPDDQVTTYYDAIERAEELDGAYASGLVDLYYGLGQSLLELGDLEGARDAFHRTVLIARVNSGPNSLEQTNYLYSIVDIESRLGNLAAAVDVMENIYLINARNYGEDNPALLPAVIQLSNWYSKHHPLRAETARPSDFENLSYLASHIARLREAEYGLGDVRTALSYRVLGQLHFLAVHHYVMNQTFPEPTLVLDFERIGGKELRERPLEHHYEAGEAAFRRAVEAWDAMPDATSLQRAEARAQLGDWFLALKSFRKAEGEYERAYRELAGDPEQGPLADAYLGHPTEVRFLNPTGTFVRELSAFETGNELEVSMTVTRTGNLSDIEFVRVPSDASEAQLQAIIDYLQNTRFRPAVVDGAVQTIEGSRWTTTLSESNNWSRSRTPSEEDAVPEQKVKGNET